MSLPSKFLVFMFSTFWVCVTFGQDSKTVERKGSAAKSIATTTLSRFDTVKYDDGKLVKRITNVNRGDKLGVWFTPPQRTAACSLYAVQYFFSSIYGQATGFVNQADTGTRATRRVGSQVESFAVYPSSPATVILARPLPVRMDSDFFIGWVSGWVDTSVSPVGLGDSAANYTPRRSYQNMASPDSLVPLRCDLGIRAIFGCTAPPADSGKYSFELRWNKPNVDLDLYLFLKYSPNSPDTIYWRKPKVAGIRRLDVDDRDGFGPERITLPLPFPPAHCDSVAQLKVHYYGPRNGPPAKATVLVFQGNKKLAQYGPCTLFPLSQDSVKGNLWNVGRFNSCAPIDSLKADSSYTVVRDTTLRLIKR
ncbi:MAG: hypothetical protein WBW16_14270 [Bacteroidota bacterium]